MTSSQTNLFAPEQFRITRLQVYNWGTFSNLHNIPISERGFLFVGRSGAGKSTLLDAFSALLVPPKWIDFNAAAREIDRGNRDRNFVSYIRGAWAEQKDDESGVIATQYLRPGTTWSALALSYSTPQGQTVVLVQLFWLRGNANNNAEVRRHFLIFERPFDLQELQDFDLNVRTLKQTFPDAHAYDEFRPYCDRFCRLLGIETEKALRLLHKTQSAKNLGDLNTFLRDFMLDKPDTFEAAERLVDEFSELKLAHQTVVIAREQVQTLVPAREEHQHLQILQVERHSLQELSAGIDQYKKTHRKTLLEEKIKAFQVEAEGLAGAVNAANNFYTNQKATLLDLEQQQRDIGGNQLMQWENEKNILESQLNERSRKQSQIQNACQQLGWALPGTAQGFAELIDKARQELAENQQNHNDNRDNQFYLVGQKNEIETKFANAIREIKTLKRHPNNIPAAMVELRDSIAAALNLHESALPFVGELIEVRPQEAAWQGAIERLLKNFALSLLVDEKNYAALSNYINQQHLGKRLVYFRISSTDAMQDRVLAPNSLIHKLNIKEGKYFSWLNDELHQRFDYACVDNIQAFRNATKALTQEGQIRHSKDRHEKDDRFHVGDKTQWVLGFNNREKLALYESQAQELADAISKLDSTINNLIEKDQQREARGLQCQTLADTQWHEIDITPLLDRFTTLKEQLTEFRAGNKALDQLDTKIMQQKKMVEQADSELHEIKSKQRFVVDEITKSQNKLVELKDIVSTLTSFQQQALSTRFNDCTTKITLDNLDDTASLVERKLVKEIESLNAECSRLYYSIENRFAKFKQKWPMDASDMDANLASAPDFFAKLTRLETDGLPAHEQRFFELLQNQSHQNLAALSTHLIQARKEIMKRMEFVNASLGQAQFNPGTYLFIDVSDRQLAEVREFKRQIQQALSYALMEDREQAEARFQILSDLVELLKSQEPDKCRWREAVLDVRLHVEFIGRERDQNNQEVEVYRSGAGKSGGQRQKLATTCLAAALRYQLGGNDRHIPTYAPVILDEAFDKADNEFTTLAMKIFENFGFQMIVATPLKSVMTLEPFIGGACFVDIRDRRYSTVLSLAYDLEQQRLDLSGNDHDHATTSVA